MVYVLEVQIFAFQSLGCPLVKDRSSNISLLHLSNIRQSYISSQDPVEYNRRLDKSNINLEAKG